jgi:hypothetical protein
MTSFKKPLKGHYINGSFQAKMGCLYFGKFFAQSIKRPSLIVQITTSCKLHHLIDGRNEDYKYAVAFLTSFFSLEKRTSFFIR